MNSFILHEIVTIFIFISIDEESETWPSLLQCHSTPFFLTTFQNRSIVNLQCCVGFSGVQQIDSVIHIPIVFIFFSFTGYSKILTIVPCAIQ